MTIGYIGLGKMGKNMVLHLLEKGIDVVAWNRSPEPRFEVSEMGATAVDTIEELVERLESPRVIWVMLSPGEVTDHMLEHLFSLLKEGDMVIDGGNSFYKDSIRHAEKLQEKGIHFLDVGVSGGPAGARNGACLLIGGEHSIFQKLIPLFEVVSQSGSYGYVGAHGAGHFAKMVHNGIEYGMMEAISEGASILKSSNFHFNVGELFQIYNNGSVIESKLVGWASEALAENPELDAVASHIDHTGEGEWTVKAAKELGVPVPVIKSSFDVRVKSSQDAWDSPAGFRNKVVSALRRKFGGHDVTVR